jgi:hypothetical protein
MALLLDLIGSALIGGILVLQLLNMSLFVQNATYRSDNELIMQQNAKTLAEIINYDFRKIGYNFDSTAVLTAEQKKIKFVGDLERPGETGAGTIDTVEYFVLDSTYATSTSNPRDIVLIRVLNNKDSIAGPTLGLVDIKFSYLDSVYTTTADLSKIKYIKTELWIEPTERSDDFITGEQDTVFTYWEFTIHPRNI